MNSTVKKIDALRVRIADLHAQLTDPAQTSPSRTERLAEISSQVDAWHAQAEARLLEDMQSGGADSVMLTAHEFGIPLEHLPSALSEQAVDSRAWLTFALGKKEMVARLTTIIDRMPAGADQATRNARLNALQRDLIEAEIREEALLREAEAEGLDIDPRPDQRAHAAILIGFGK